jgi:TolB protein
MEPELRRLLESKADEMSLPPAIPDGLQGRVRRRRVFTVVVATAVVAGVVMGSATAVTSLRRDDGGIDPAPELTGLPDEADFDIYTMNVKGKEITRVTGSPDNEVHPAWSPTHNLVAFARHEALGPGHIFVTNGQKEVQVTFGDAFDEQPVWSPNGKKIAFIRSVAGEYESRILVVNVENLYLADGSANQITRPARRLVKQAGTVTERWPTWAPDGKSIAFVGGDNTVYSVNTDGSNLRPIFKDSNGVERLAYNPVTGDLLLTIHSPVDHFRVMSPSGKLGPLIGPARIPQYLPAWSPNGRLIVFVTGDVEDDEIFVMRADGTRRRRLTDNLRQDAFPGFSPNGRYIVFSSNR